MADRLTTHEQALQRALDGEAALVRELHHRIKNNFQVIASLLSLHRQALPEERRDDVRFIEDHVQAMAVGYRGAYATEAMTEVAANDVLRDVVAGLRRSAGLPGSRLRLVLGPEPLALDLDQAIGVGLFLAAALPPRLDQATVAGTEVTVRGMARDGLLELSIASTHDVAPAPARAPGQAGAGLYAPARGARAPALAPERSRHRGARAEAHGGRAPGLRRALSARHCLQGDRTRTPLVSRAALPRPFPGARKRRRSR